MTVEIGSDRLLASGRLNGCRVGLVSNPASVNGALLHMVDLLATQPRVTLGAVFGPQHGFHADVQDNMIETGHVRDQRRRIPIYSLYSETREPTADMLAGLDALVVDLQDVGSRIYTFVYTMANCLKAGRRHGVKVIVCDRPNPIGGEAVEGETLRPGFESFVGLFPIPMRHGMTIGELAMLFNHHFGIGADLEVVRMSGWRRSMYWDQTGLPWVMPSPNMPTLDTAIVYPGAVLFEGTQLSEGRGTTRPFECIGLPGIDAWALSGAMNRIGLDGVYFRPIVFEPTFQKHARVTCGGCQMHVTDRAVFRPVEAGVSLMSEFRRQAPERFAWRQPPYEYEHEKMPIDILAGSSSLREQIEAGVPGPEMAAGWAGDEAAFRELRSKYLIYGD